MACCRRPIRMRSRAWSTSCTRSRSSQAPDNSGVGDDAEAEVAPGGVAGVLRPGRDPVAVAVGVVTQVRAAPHRPGHLAATVALAAVAWPTAAAGLPAVRRPLPDVAGHVVE